MNTIEKARMQLGTHFSRTIAFLVIASCAAYGAEPQAARPTQNGQSSGGVSPTGSTVQPGGRGSSAVLVTPEVDYRIGPNDVIDIQIENAPELSRTFRVTAAGTFLMPYVGRITAAKKTIEELAQFITDSLKGDYLKDPKVVVNVKEYNSRSFFIQGSVRSPGVFQIEGRPSLLELITLAGGLSETHGSNAFIIRRQKGTEQKEPEPTPASSSSGSVGVSADQDSSADELPKFELKSVNITALLRGHFEKDMFLEPGDIINVPAADVFFVAGEVNKPGSFSLKEGTTLRQAISLAQGTNYKAALDRGIVFREGTSGKLEELHVDIGAVMSGKKPDVAIVANDIIMVPNSRGKTIGGAVLKALSGSASSVIRY